MTELRVLLVSPVRDADPLSGDVTYTEQLLAAPPPGVRFTTYVDALAAGTLVECGTRDALRAARGWRRLENLGLAVWRKSESLIRSSGLVFRERLRHFRVAPGAFDLIHVHVFHSRFLGSAPPVVMSAAGPLEWIYRDAWGWSQSHVVLASAFDRAVGAMWNASMCGVRKGRAAGLVAFSSHFRSWLLSHGWPTDLIAVVPNYLDLWVSPDRPSRPPVRLGFIAKDFEAKGGSIALEAFDELRARHPELELLVVGSPSRLPEWDLATRRITWRSLVRRDELLGEILPEIDILIYPSLMDGLPYGPMEAMAAGIPCVVSDYRALPELVGAEAGRVSHVGEVRGVVSGVEELLDRDVWEHASHAARARFQERFSAQTQAAELGSAYRRFGRMAYDGRP